MAVFDVSELIEMAVKDEETGIAFYKALAQKTTSDVMKKACEQIARQEEHHRDRFRAILEQVGGYEPYEQYAGQYESYVKTLLDEKAFPEPEAAAEKARAVGSDREAVEIAMRMERDTLLFLQEVKAFVHQKQSPYIDEIIEEERQHLVDLAQLKASLT